MNSWFWIIMSTHTATGIWVRKTGGNLLRLKVPGNLCGEKVPGIFTGGGKGAGDGKRCREFVRPVGKGLVTGDYQ